MEVYIFFVIKKLAMDQAGCFENTQASLSSTFGRGTMPAQPSNGFLCTQPGPIHITKLQMLARVIIYSHS
jgi:hypothetical protein